MAGMNPASAALRDAACRAATGVRILNPSPRLYKIHFRKSLNGLFYYAYTVIIMLTLDAIRIRAVPIAKKYNVTQLELFGSYANGTADDDSDADFLAGFDSNIPSIFKVMGFREELSASLGMPVDIVTLPITDPEKLHVSQTEKII